MNDTLLHVLVAAAAAEPEAPLLITATERHSRGAVLAQVRRLAGALAEAGVGPGDRVAVFDEDYLTVLTAPFACWWLGAACVPLNVTQPAAVLADLVARSRPKVVLAAPGAPLPEQGVWLDPRALPEATAPGAPLATAEADALILFTSGTTGAPKGVVHPHHTLLANAEGAAARCALTPDDRVYVNTPPYFTSGLVHFFTMLVSGGSLVGRKGFHFGDGLIAELAETGCTGFGGAPAHIVRVLAGLPAPIDPGALRFWVSSGDHLPADVATTFLERLPGVRLHIMYGLTELAGRLCTRDAADVAHRGSVGTPIAGMRVSIRDEDDVEVAPGEIGQVHADGPLLMRGYLDDPESTAAALGSYGLRTGDYGYVDEDGYVYLRGRRDDIFQRGGEKVSTNTVAAAVSALPGVIDAACVAVADEVAGAVPVAVVVAEPSFSPRKARKALRGTLAPVAMPARFVQVDEIPRTGSGKVIRKRVAALLDDA